jgi:hypothetical protein
VALGSHEGGFRVALGWLWGRNGVPSICLVYGFGVAWMWLWVALTGSKSRSWYHKRPETPKIADRLRDGGARRTGERCSSCKPFIFRVFRAFRGLAGCSCVQWIALVGVSAGFDNWTRCYPMHYLIDSGIT